MNTVVIYHKADFDGIFSREIAKLYFKETADYVGWDYGDTLPTIGAYVREIYMIDISIDGMMDDPRLVWIDHHKSAMDKFSPSIHGFRIDGVAACRLAWQWFFTYNNGRNPLAESDKILPGRQAFVDRKVWEPISVRLAGEYDIWDKRDPRAELFQHGLRSMDIEPHWAQILSTKNPTISEIEALSDVGQTGMIEPDGTMPPAIVWQLLEQGRALQYAKTKENDGIAKQFGFTIEFEGLTFLAINAARYNSFLFTAGLKPEHDGCFGFNFDGKQWRVSLYGVPGKLDVDLAKIALKYGGGGHKQACGFKIEKLPFLP